MRRAISLLAIACHTGADQIFPTISAAAISRHDMIDRKLAFLGAAVLTLMPVPPDNIFPIE